MKYFFKRLKFAYKLIRAKRLIFIWVENDPDETMDWTSFELKPQEIPLFCDIVSIDVSEILEEYKDKEMSEHIGQNMINFLNLN